MTKETLNLLLASLENLQGLVLKVCDSQEDLEIRSHLLHAHDEISDAVYNIKKAGELML